MRRESHDSVDDGRRGKEGSIVRVDHAAVLLGRRRLRIETVADSFPALIRAATARERSR